jgi:hypothetical protein
MGFDKGVTAAFAYDDALHLLCLQAAPQQTHLSLSTFTSCVLPRAVVLQAAEVQELVLEGKRSAKAAEQAELAGRLAEVGRALDAKRAAGDAAAARRAAVVAELEVLLADQDAFREQLTKVFNR